MQDLFNRDPFSFYPVLFPLSVICILPQVGEFLLFKSHPKKKKKKKSPM